MPRRTPPFFKIFMLSVATIETKEEKVTPFKIQKVMSKTIKTMGKTVPANLPSTIRVLISYGQKIELLKKKNNEIRLMYGPAAVRRLAASASAATKAAAKQSACAPKEPPKKRAPKRGRPKATRACDV